MTTSRPVYLDYHATTPVDPRVREAMLSCLEKDFGNPASAVHAYGMRAEAIVEEARASAARLVGARPEEIIFTSGATESNNLALKGIFEMYGSRRGRHIITQATEHKSVLETCKTLEKQGIQVTYLPVDESGRIRLSDLEAAVTEHTVLVSVMAANNEVGTLQPVDEIGAFTRSRGILFHTDAAQAAGSIGIDVERMKIDLLSFTSHKMCGPKGAGALYLRSRNPRVRVVPQIHGGGQEKGLRSGTLNVPAIAGFGRACTIAASEMKTESERLRKMRDFLQARLEKELDHIQLNGHPENRLAHNLNLSFLYVEGETLISNLSRDLAISSGSACSSGRAEPSHVLRAMGLREERISSSVRFGLGRFTQQGDVETAARKVIQAVTRLRELSPLYHQIKKGLSAGRQGGLRDGRETDTGGSGRSQAHA